MTKILLALSAIWYSLLNYSEAPSQDERVSTTITTTVQRRAAVRPPTRVRKTKSPIRVYGSQRAPKSKLRVIRHVRTAGSNFSSSGIETIFRPKPNLIYEGNVEEKQKRINRINGILNIVDGYKIPIRNGEMVIKSHVAPTKYRKLIRWSDTYKDICRRAERRYGLSRGIMEVLTWVESGHNRFAISPSQAYGLTQIITKNWKKRGITRDNWFIPEVSIMGGASHLRDCFDEFSNEAKTVAKVKAIACYNAGARAVKNSPNLIPHNGETEFFTASVLTYHNLYKRGF